MRCDDVERVLMRYADGRLDAPQTTAVDAHLDVCRRCRALYADEIEMVEAFQPLAERGQARELLEGVMREVERPQHGAIEPDIPRPTLALVTGLAAMAAALVAVFSTHGVERMDRLPSAEAMRAGVGEVAGWIGWPTSQGLQKVTEAWTSVRLVADDVDPNWFSAGTLACAAVCVVLVIAMRGRLAKELET